MHAHPLIGNAENTGNINAAGAAPKVQLSIMSRRQYSFAPAAVS
jgi:hypothetical protein